MDKITGFLPGIVKIPTSVQISRFTTTWLLSGFRYSSQFSKIPLILREFHNKNKHGALREAVQAMLIKR